RQLSVRGEKILHPEKLIGLFRFAETVIDHAQENAAGEILVTLEHIDIARADTGLTEKPRGNGLEIGRGEIRRVMDGGTRAISATGGRRQQIGRAMRKIARALRRNQNDGSSAIRFLTAIVE